MRGIDVSHYQQGLDLSALAGTIDFVIVRVAQGVRIFDESAPVFYTAARRGEIPVGCYQYSEALTPEQAEAEAHYLLSWFRGWPMPCGVYMDVEMTAQLRLPAAQLQAVVDAWCRVIREAGYTPGVYSSELSAWSKLDAAALGDDVLIWVARYGRAPDMACDVWQSSETGSVPGWAKGVDTDVAMSQRFARLVEGGLPQSAEPTAPPEEEPAADSCPIGDGCASTDISVELALLAEYLQTKDFQAGFLAFVAGKEHIA